jgi:hypothetical protein
MNSLQFSKNQGMHALHCVRSYKQIAEEPNKIKEGSRVNPRKGGNHL